MRLGLSHGLLSILSLRTYPFFTSPTLVLKPKIQLQHGLFADQAQLFCPLKHGLTTLSHMQWVQVAAISLTACLFGCSASSQASGQHQSDWPISEGDVPNAYGAPAWNGAGLEPYGIHSAPGPWLGYPQTAMPAQAQAGPVFVFPAAAASSPSPVLTGAPSPPAGAAVEAPKDTRPRMGAVRGFAYIYKKAAKAGLALGYIRLGTSVPLLSETPVKGDGCKKGWYPVSPRGYACLDHKTTLDLSDPYYQALQSVAPSEGVWPYRYAFSNGAPMYSRVPTAEEAAKAEKKYGPPGSYVQLAEWSAGHEELLTSERIVATDPVPAYFASGKRSVGGGPHDVRRLIWREIPNGSMVAYAKAFEANGRVWLLTPDLMLVPADRVRALRRSEFQGIALGNGIELPLAWNRHPAAKPKYKQKEDGALIRLDGAFAPKSAVPVSGEPVSLMGKHFYAIRGEPGFFVAVEDVTVSRARGEMPAGLAPNRKWIEAKIVPGTLTAYEGLRPVYATLFSPGKGGVPMPGKDHTKYATTALGYFPIEWKDRVATMSNEKGEPKILWFSDVPHIQYLRPPLAMHVSYWHEDFGRPKSAECVNVSPKDGAWLFQWTEPALPEGWGGIRPGDGNGFSTPVLITSR